MRWLRERLEWEDQRVRQSVAVTIFCVAILVILLLVPSPNGRSLLGAAFQVSGSDIALIGDVGIGGSSADDGNGSGQNALRKRFLEAGLVLDADLSSFFEDGADNPIQGSEDSRSDRTTEDTAEDAFAGGPLGSSFGQLEGGPGWTRPSSGFGGGGFAISGVVGSGAGARATGASDGGAVHSGLDTNQVTATSHALNLSSGDASGADPGNGNAASDELGTGDGNNRIALAFLPDNAISGGASTVTVYPASGGSTIVSDASGPDPFSGPTNDDLTSAVTDPAPVPEPTGLILFGSGLVMVARRLRR
jgi:hypothetical protein